MTKRFAVVGAIVAACLATAGASLSAPIPVGAGLVVQPHQVPVPAWVVAAHPTGQAGAFSAVPALQPVGDGGPSTNAADRVSCWRAYFANDHSIPLGTEREWINPGWCGNGSVLKSIDTSWHGQTCSILVSCQGENGPGTWYGCATGCGSIGQQIDGQFGIHLPFGTALYVTDTVLYELYPDGGSWAYYYHS